VLSRAVSRTPQLQPGTVFAGRYRVVRRLGHGAMAAVYLVEEADTGARRALKVMNRELSRDRRFAARFAQEAVIGRGIRSEHVVAVLDAGIDSERGLSYLVMEHLEGVDLERWLARRIVVSRAEAVAFLTQLFDAVGAAHAAAIVHRDLKPENVFVTTRAGREFLTVLDFGVAKVVRAVTLSNTAPGLGSPLWTAPEQGESGKVTPSADVWALGLIAFRLLAGRVFWKTIDDPHASQFDVAFELLRAPLPLASARARELGCDPDALPAGFDDWFACAVARDPAARFVDARPAWAALAPLLAPSALPK
jgi:serine/threonine protein kinase